jgi:hypothetical protein
MSNVHDFPSAGSQSVCPTIRIKCLLADLAGEIENHQWHDTQLAKIQQSALKILVSINNAEGF